MTDVATFVRKRRFEWVDYPTEPTVNPESGETTFTPDPDFAGFRVRVYANSTMEEVRHQEKQWAAFVANELPEWDYMTEFAERIVAWNYASETVDGEVVPVPPPAEDPHAFYLLPAAVMYWLLGATRVAHLPKGLTATGSTPSPNAGTTATKTPTKTTRAKTPRRS